MNKPLFSIVIPVFNIQNYIGECLESVINQSFGNFEAIVIDDGSTDNSGLICDEYASKDSRIKVIHQKNKGLSGARNTGIENSQGKWLLFLDGDDLLPHNALELWISKINQPRSQVLVGRYSILKQNCEIDRKEGKHIDFKESVLPTGDLKNAILKYVSIADWSVWKSAYRLDFIQKNNLYFDDAINYSEDLFWILKLFQTVDQIQFVDIDIYFYRICRDNNQTLQTNKMMLGAVQTFDKFHKEFSGKNLSENEKFILSYLADVFLILIGHGIKLDSQALHLRRQIINNNIKILNYIDKTVTPSKRYLAQFAIKLFGINFADYIMNLLKR